MRSPAIQASAETDNADRCATTHKVTYATARDAREGMLLILSRPAAWARPSRPVKHFRCEGCDGWHLTAIGPGPGTPRDAGQARAMLAALSR